MSLDISLTAVRETTVFDANYTHNVTPMWRKAGCYEALYRSEGKTAADVLPALEIALTNMRADPDGYQALNPPNGWGSYDSAVDWLGRLVAAFKANPDGKIWVSA